MSANGLRKTFRAVLVGLVLTSCGLDRGPKPDEWVIFYPTYGRLDPVQREWVLSIHGWVFGMEGREKDQDGGLQRFANALGVSSSEGRMELFRARAGPFLAGSTEGRRISIEIGDTMFALGKSAENGHIQASLRVPADARRGLTQRRDFTEGWLAYRAITRRGDRRDFTGAVQLVAETGISVISDIDDTIKVTQVLDRKALLANTFLREYRPVPGMAEVYQRWARVGAVFHYVSASPWQLYAPLSEFLRRHGFPAGSLDMKYFRWKDSSFLSLFASPEQSKPAVIERILAAFPRRRFILVGDNGEKDPEIYGALARKFPAQVAAIRIRNVTGEDPGGARFARALANVPRDRWRVFDSAESLPSGHELQQMQGEQERAARNPPWAPTLHARAAREELRRLHMLRSGRNPGSRDVP